MSNLSPSQFPAGPNPFLLLIGGINKGLSLADQSRQRQLKALYYQSRFGRSDNESYKTSMTLQKHTIPTPSNTGAPIPGYTIQKPITPESTGAPMPGELAKNTAIHPITGARVPRTPVKPRGKKQTPPGTKPKRR